MGEIFENKKILIGLVLGIIYIFIVLPVENTIFNIKRYEEKESYFNERVEIKNIVLKDLRNIKNEINNLDEKLEKISLNDKDSFSSLGECQKFFNEKFIEFNLETLEIGRTEIKETEYTVPYLLKGKPEDIINFLMYTDKNKNINILKRPFEIIKEKEDTKLRFSLNTKIDIKKDKSFDKNYKEKNILKNYESSVEILKFSLINEETGIFYIKHENKIMRYYLKNRDIFRVGEVEYEVIFSNKKVIFENKEKGNIIIYLEEKIEK